MTNVELMTAAVTANPADVTARLVLADAVTEDTGDYDRAKLEAGITAFVAAVDKLTAEHYAKSFTSLIAPSHRADYISDKWCRIVTVENYRDGRKVDASVYCFICLKDNTTRNLGHVRAGDIHKAAGFKAPAKHARGNVFTADFNKCAGPRRGIEGLGEPAEVR